MKSKIRGGIKNNSREKSRKNIFILWIKAQSSEQAAVEQEKVQNQLEEMSVKLNEVANTKEPVVAFRGTGVKDSGTSSEQYLDNRHGEF